MSDRTKSPESVQTRIRVVLSIFSFFFLFISFSRQIVVLSNQTLIFKTINDFPFEGMNFWPFLKVLT